MDLVQGLGITAIHVDVVDGHFRPQISVGQPVVKSIRNATRMNLDVHLMIERPERYVEDFVKAGADSIAFHPESTQNASLAISTAKRLGAKVGVAVNTTMPLEACYELLEDIGYVLIENGNKESRPRSLKKIVTLANERAHRELNFAIAAEGEFGADEANDLLSAGADILVVGSAIFDKAGCGEAMRSLAKNLSQQSPPAGPEIESRVR